MRKNILASLFILTASGCVTIPNQRVCSVAGVVNAGAICAETQTDKTFDLDVDALIEMLEPQPERPDPENPGETLPARAGALIIPMDDYVAGKNAGEKACRMLGKRCKPEFKSALKNMLPRKIDGLKKMELK